MKQYYEKHLILGIIKVKPFLIGLFQKVDGMRIFLTLLYTVRFVVKVRC